MKEGFADSYAPRILFRRAIAAVCSAAPVTWCIFVALALALSICAADAFVPLFWARRPFIQGGFIAASILLQVPFLIPAITTARRLFGSEADRAGRLAWLIMAGALLVTGSLVIANGAQVHLAVGAMRALHPSGPPAYVLNSQSEFAFAAVLAAFFGMIAFDLAVKRLDAMQRAVLVLGFLGFCFLCTYVANDLVPAMNSVFSPWTFNQNLPHNYVFITPVGWDFRVAIYRPAQVLLSGKPVWPTSIFPPLVPVMGLPYLLFDENTAYVVHAVLLVVVGVLCLALAGYAARRLWRQAPDWTAAAANVVHIGLPALMLGNLLTGYPFVFSIERGNFDAIAMLFCLASLVVLLAFPERMWLQVILLSIAVHIKIYPVFLFAVLLYKHRLRIVLPALLVNVGLLLVIGPANAVGFVTQLRTFYNQAPPGTASASGYSFAWLAAQDFGIDPVRVPAMQIGFTFLPVVVWLGAWLAISRLHNSDDALVTSFMITVPVMCTFPVISHDYKLVILSSAVLLFLSRIVRRMHARRGAADYLLLLLVAVLMLIIGRTDLLMGTSLQMVQDKYIWVLLIELLMLADILRHSPGRGSAVLA